MLTIGDVQLEVPFVQAAMAGYSDLAMRRIARRHGAAYALAEVVLDRLVTHKGKTRRRILQVAGDDHPVGGQLMGAEPDQFAQAAADLVDAGYDVIDLNFGCPVRKVLGRCRGGFHLSQPKVALEIVEAVVQAVAGRRPVTVKMRRGMDHSPQAQQDFFAILDGAFERGIAAITVHGRTVRQRYVGPSDWSFLARVKRHAGDRVILGSGDLFTAQDCLNMIERTGVDGVSIARGCVGNPWIFAECRALFTGQPLPDPPSVAQQGKVIADHYREMVDLYGEETASKRLRKFGIKYSEWHPQSKEVRDAFISCRTAVELQAVLTRWYDPSRAWPPVTRPVSPGHLIAAGARGEAAQG